jgi:hypothetical protein
VIKGERMKRLQVLFTVLTGFLMISAPGHAQEKSSEDLAMEAQNPVAELVSLPLQNNMNFNVGPNNAIQNVLNIQPVVPIPIHEKWNVITRTILPVIWQPELPFPGQSPPYGNGQTIGLGDINLSAFLSPSQPGKLIWGVGPVFLFPSATDTVLGNGKWGVGPSAVLLMVNTPWVNGILINNIWSFAGSPSRMDVSQMLIQPFVNFNFPGGWYLSSAPIITANWNGPSGNKWTLPIGGGGGKLIKLGKLPLNCSIQAFYLLDKPVNGPDWTLRLQVQALLPNFMGEKSGSGE